MAHRPATILLTRPQADAARFAQRLRAHGVTAPIEISAIVEIVPTGAEVDFTGLTGAVFSSRNGVAMAPAQDLPAWCVGAATAEAAVAKGWQAVAADGDAEALYARILADAPRGPLVHFRGALSRGDLAARLTAAGIKTQETVVYDQVPVDLTEAAKSLLMRENPLIVPLFSPNAAAVFSRQLRTLEGMAAPIHVVAISAATQEALGDLPCEQVVLAAKKQANAMADAITRLLDAV
ncbi:uroporphyrinogen-III synthase [Shimia sp. R10_1]|uniref:uroporphyrinogen-III synthase n=1 Tax=Shimia sp. R10_1 TaxID=2821095 RepID=UPI001ADB071A|nr:uroporphyrinogen-III synthase [Shimia sp. R10_1]MBO9473246.1 uroporphyrinogen-III synthase [Shimia sp. R10_1]